MTSTSRRYAKPGKGGMRRTKIFVYKHDAGNIVGHQASHSLAASHEPSPGPSQGHQVPTPSTRLAHTLEAIPHPSEQGQSNKGDAPTALPATRHAPHPHGFRLPGRSRIQGTARMPPKPPLPCRTPKRSAPRWRMQCAAMADAVRCVGGCSAPRWRMHCAALADALRCVLVVNCRASVRGGGPSKREAFHARLRQALHAPRPPAPVTCTSPMAPPRPQPSSCRPRQPARQPRRADKAGGAHTRNSGWG